MLRFLFLISILTFCNISFSQKFCSEFFDNNLDLALSYDNNPNNTQFRFKNLSDKQVSFTYQGTSVSIGNSAVSQWFSGSSPSSSNLDCSSVKIDGYPLRNFEYIYNTYYGKYNQYPHCNNKNCSSVITQRKQIIAEIQQLKQTVPSWFASKNGGLNFMIDQSQVIIEECNKHLSQQQTNEIQNSNQYNLNKTNNQSGNTPNSSNGVTMSDVQRTIDENNKLSDERLGISNSNPSQSTEQIIIGGAVEIFNIYAQARQAEREREEREAEQRRIQAEQEEEQRRIQADKLQRMINNRSAIVQKFPSKDIPLSSQEKASKIYYFVYAVDYSKLNQEFGATVYVSNVFEIGTYSDGTRSYTSLVNNEIADLSPFSEVLHGYYYTESEAQNVRNYFVNSLKNNGVAIVNITYAGKPTNSSIKNDQTKEEDFWGETKSDKKLDPATINTNKPSELPREEQKKEKSYWD